MGYRSTTLIVILVFGILFSLLYSSSILANQDTGGLYQILASKRADIEIYRLRAPQNICFELDSENLNIIDKNIAKELSDSGGDTLSAAIKRADSDVQFDQQLEQQLQPPKKYFEMMGNRYSGEGLHLEKAEAIVPFLKTYESKLDHTVERLEKRKGISDDLHHYNCNFAYNDKYYGINLKLYSLSSLNEYAGYLPIIITKESLENRNYDALSGNATVFKFFNNTVVWENKSDSWLTLQITTGVLKDYNIIASDVLTNASRSTIIAVKLAPSMSWDLSLGTGFRLMGMTTFHYQIKEYPWIQGDIFLKNYPVCMNFDTARSLYSQTKFPFMTPSYVPEGYEYKCMQADTASVQLYYSNQTFYPRFMGEGLVEGQIRIKVSDEDRYYGLSKDSSEASQSDEERIRNDYESILKRNPAIDPQLIHINGKLLAWGNEATPTGAKQSVVFPDGSQITTTSALPARLTFYDNKTGIRLEGYVPLQELVKMAESMRKQL